MCVLQSSITKSKDLILCLIFLSSNYFIKKNCLFLSLIMNISSKSTIPSALIRKRILKFIHLELRSIKCIHAKKFENFDTCIHKFNWFMMQEFSKLIQMTLTN